MTDAEYLADMERLLELRRMDICLFDAALHNRGWSGPEIAAFATHIRPEELGAAMDHAFEKRRAALDSTKEQP
jgi:hypothetical protein